LPEAAKFIETFGEIRSVTLDGEPYFVGVDIARALEYAKPSQAVIDHCKGIRKLGIPSHNQHGAEVVQETNTVPLGDLFRLIVKAATQSRNPEIQEKAEAYESWIFDEVLPAIHKTGGYQPAKERDPNLTKAFCLVHAKCIAATSYMEFLTRRMESQGNTPQEINTMVLMVAKTYSLPIPERFVKEPPFEQLRLVYNVPKPV
jgi:prophage antirepressor-like protein